MWKLLSGIALVIVLDVAFIWMMAVEPDAPEIARAIGPTAAVPVIHDQQMSAPVAIDDSTEPVVADDSFEVPGLRESRERRPGSGSADKVAQPDSATVAAATPSARPFQDTIIWIGRTEVPVKIDQREEVPVVTESTPDEAMQASVSEPRIVQKRKRSFQSKAFGVIKKPYDWMKALADKLQ